MCQKDLSSLQLHMLGAPPVPPVPRAFKGTGDAAVRSVFPMGPVCTRNVALERERLCIVDVIVAWCYSSLLRTAASNFVA